MQEVTIKLTMDEAKSIRAIVGMKLDESNRTAEVIKSQGEKAPIWLEEQVQRRSNIYDKISDAIDASFH